MQNAASRTAKGCTQDTNLQHLHDETLTLPMRGHLRLHASQCKRRTQRPSHPLHRRTSYFNTPGLKGPTIFNNGRYTAGIPTDPTQSLRPTYKQTCAMYIHQQEAMAVYCAHWLIWGKLTRLAPVQLGAGKSPFLKSCLHRVDAGAHPSPLFPLCGIHSRDAHHLFGCTHIRTTLSPLDLWRDPTPPE